MRSIMLDLETLDVIPSSVILSLGAVEFFEDGFGREFHERIDIDSCLQHGMTVSGKTIQWWMAQDGTARKIFKTAGRPLDRVLREFKAVFDWEDMEVWANGTNFDIPILENAFRATSIIVPWKYNAVRDYRTFKNEFPTEIYEANKIPPAVAHDALSDARAQALTLQRLRRWRFNYQETSA